MLLHTAYVQTLVYFFLIGARGEKKHSVHFKPE